MEISSSEKSAKFETSNFGLRFLTFFEMPLQKKRKKRILELKYNACGQSTRNEVIKKDRIEQNRCEEDSAGCRRLAEGSVDRMTTIYTGHKPAPGWHMTNVLAARGQRPAVCSKRPYICRHRTTGSRPRDISRHYITDHPRGRPVTPATAVNHSCNKRL